MTKRYGWYIVGLLTIINFVNYVDRMVIAILVEPRRMAGFQREEQREVSPEPEVVNS